MSGCSVASASYIVGIKIYGKQLLLCTDIYFHQDKMQKRVGIKIKKNKIHVGLCVIC